MTIPKAVILSHGFARGGTPTVRVRCPHCRGTHTHTDPGERFLPTCQLTGQQYTVTP